MEQKENIAGPVANNKLDSGLNNKMVGTDVRNHIIEFENEIKELKQLKQKGDYTDCEHKVPLNDLEWQLEFFKTHNFPKVKCTKDCENCYYYDTSDYPNSCYFEDCFILVYVEKEKVPLNMAADIECDHKCSKCAYGESATMGEIIEGEDGKEALDNYEGDPNEILWTCPIPLQEEF